MVIYIYTDGASRGNPGRSASGFLAVDENGRRLYEESFYNGIKTNNEAEYIALIGALRKVAKGYGYSAELVIYSDSELMVNQISGRFRVRRRHLIELNEEVLSLLSKFSRYEIKSVGREEEHITHVDRNLNRLLDKLR